MSKSAPNPLASTYSSYQAPSSTTSTQTISHKTLTIAGLLCTIYGLDELSPTAPSLTCLWLLHPRLQTQECMAPIAASILQDYNTKRRKCAAKRGLIAVAFDQRNHGSREVDARANEAWRSGNPTHAQDMFSAYNGTAHDTSHLLSFLPSYLPQNAPSIAQNVVLGISLGGHAAWHVVLRDSRFSAAVIIIGCPDYTYLMSDRARLSKLSTSGEGFVGSKDFPLGLVECVRQWDPVGCVMNAIGRPPGAKGWDGLTLRKDEEKILRPGMEKWFKDKMILNLSGGADKLVPYRCGESFLRWLKASLAKADGGELFDAGDGRIEDLVFDGVGHEVSQDMVREAVRFVGDCVEGDTLGRAMGTEERSSRM